MKVKYILQFYQFICSHNDLFQEGKLVKSNNINDLYQEKSSAIIYI